MIFRSPLIGFDVEMQGWIAGRDERPQRDLPEAYPGLSAELIDATRYGVPDPELGHDELSRWLTWALRRQGWLPREEVTIDGSRKRADLIAYHPGSGRLRYVVEVKRAIANRFTLNAAIEQADNYRRLWAAAGNPPHQTFVVAGSINPTLLEVRHPNVEVATGADFANQLREFGWLGEQRGRPSDLEIRREFAAFPGVDQRYWWEGIRVDLEQVPA